MNLTDRMEQIGDAAERALLRLWDALAAGELTADAFLSAAVVVMQTANQAAELAADAELWRELDATDPAVARIPAVAPSLAADPDRIRDGLSTVLAGTAAVETRLRRYATAEPRDAAQQRATAVITEHPNITGWRRGLNSGACQLCQWWDRNGRVWDAEHPMPRHTGCGCQPIPVVEAEL